MGVGNGTVEEEGRRRKGKRELEHRKGMELMRLAISVRKRWPMVHVEGRQRGRGRLKEDHAAQCHFHLPPLPTLLFGFLC